MPLASFLTLPGNEVTWCEGSGARDPRLAKTAVVWGYEHADVMDALGLTTRVERLQLEASAMREAIEVGVSGTTVLGFVDCGARSAAILHAHAPAELSRWICPPMHLLPGNEAGPLDTTA